MFKKSYFDRSQELYDLLKDRYPTDTRLLHLICCTQISKEVSEVLDCYPWKFERGMHIPPREKLLEEMVDVFKFFCRLLIIHEVTPEEFEKAFNEKSDIVERRLLCRTLTP